MAERSTCLRRKVGALLVRGGQILATGYNGPPHGLPHCDEVGCARQETSSGSHHERCRGLHAEQNALLQAALQGVAVEGAELICTHCPCAICMKMLVNAGIRRVVYAHPYQDPLARRIAEEAGLELVHA